MGQSNYSAAKAGVSALVPVWAKELARYGIRCMGIAPGFIETDMTADITDKARESLIKSTPLKRTGDAGEIAELVHFLLSDKSSFTTGQTHVASGGMGTLP